MLNNTTPTEAAPLSVEEMRKLLAGWCVTPEQEARAIATAACLERATNWILAHERGDGVKPIQALMTVSEALANPVAAVRLEDGAQVVAYAVEGLEVRAFGVEEAIRVVDLDERGMPREKP